MASLITLEIDERLKSDLDSLAVATQRSSSDLLEEAVRSYVDASSWQVEIQQAICEADEIGTISNEEVDAWMASWGTVNELPLPRPRREIKG